MSVSVTWYGHSNFKVSCGDVTVFIDPFFTHNPSCPVTWNEAGKPDLVLVTHDHGDHTGDAVAICKSSGATCGCIVGTAERLIDAGMPQASIPAGIGFNIGGTIEVKGVRVTMTQAFHTSESGAPAGYVVTMPDGFTFYHAGDTGLFSSMELIGSLYPLDLALLPVGGFFTMDGLQAAHAAHAGGCPGHQMHRFQCEEPAAAATPCEGHLGFCVASRIRGSRCPPGLHEAR